MIYGLLCILLMLPAFREAQAQQISGSAACDGSGPRIACGKAFSAYCTCLYCFPIKIIRCQDIY